MTYTTQQATVQAASCEGNPDCAASDAVDLIVSLAAAAGSAMPPPVPPPPAGLDAAAPSDGDTVVVGSTSGGVMFTFTAAKVTEIYVGAGAE